MLASLCRGDRLLIEVDPDSPVRVDSLDAPRHALRRGAIAVRDGMVIDDEAGLADIARDYGVSAGIVELEDPAADFDQQLAGRVPDSRVVDEIAGAARLPAGPTYPWNATPTALSAVPTTPGFALPEASSTTIEPR
jgi:hypothetical protein